MATVAYSASENGWGIADLIDNFGLSEAEVLAALLYYQENRAQIDEQERAYQAELDRLYQQHERLCLKL